ncbi:MAG TPA: hotdog fold domain-containing protein, partial [Jatrophihabitantaceae bacterium]|nr:hotdog fold domain-containing protein [Jatrophihabitantaceae bacterium]
FFAWALCLKAPYFASVHPRFDSLATGRGQVSAPMRRSVKNHLGGFHAIASCNLAELVAGTTLDASLPRSHRWIPKSMTVDYLARAATGLTATATVEDLSCIGGQESREVVVPVDVCDELGAVVVRADITMWVSPRQPR